VDEPLKAEAAKRLIRRIAKEGTVIYSQPHALDRLKKHRMTMVDCENVLRGGLVAEAEWENGAWRHHVYTGRFTVVVQFLSEEHLLVVTAWRKQWSARSATKQNSKSDARIATIASLASTTSCSWTSRFSIALALINKAARLTPAEIKYLRKTLGWSGADFARNLHVDPATVSRWESESAPQAMSESNELVLRLAVAVGQRIDDYGLERLAEVATKKVKPLRLKLRASKQGWQAQDAAWALGECSACRGHALMWRRAVS
jgi:DNA-binding transcriptional regulator YiaG